MEQIAHLLQETLTPNDTTRKQAEAHLTKLKESAEERPQLNACLFQILRSASLPLGLRHAAAIFLQNSIKAQWEPETDFPLSDEEKATLRPNVLETIFVADRKVRDALTFSITKISECDFPAQWQDAIPFIKSKLDQRDNQTNQIAFEVIVALLSKYDLHTALTQEIVPELIKLNQLIVDPVLAGLEQASAQSEFYTAKLATNVFYHLCKLDFSEEVEQTLARWMKCFHTFLQYPENEATRPLKAAAIEAINLFLCKYGDEFSSYIEHFVQTIWKLLCENNESGDDRIKIAGLEFLTTVAKSCFSASIASEETQRILCDQVVIPNVFARSYEIEQIEDDYAEYIRTDIEGNNADTRRRSACNLALAMMSNKLEKVGRPIIVAAIQSLLQKALTDIDKHWLEMDAALCLILSLSVKNEQKSLNNFVVSDSLCDLEEIYRRFVLPELSSTAVRHIVLKADALKFVCHFRYSFPAEALMNILGLLGHWISHENCVLAIYAAHCVDQIFMMRHITLRECITVEQITPLASAVMDSLEKHAASDLDRMAKALFRVTQVFQGDIAALNPRIMLFVKNRLEQSITIESNIVYLHYLFDALGFVTTAINVMDVQSHFFDLALSVLHQNVEYLVPYMLQILAQCVRVSAGAYERPLMLVSPVLNFSFYSNKRYVPSVVLFTSTVFKHYPIEKTREYITPALDLFDQLIATKPLDHEGFYLASAFVDSLPVDVLQSALPRILLTVFRRLTSAKTNKFVKNLVVWMSRCAMVLEKHVPKGSVFLMEQIDSMQSGLFELFVRNAWLPALERFVNSEERELVIGAMTALLLNSEYVMANRVLWVDCVIAQCKLIQCNQNATQKGLSIEKGNEETVSVGSRTLTSCRFQWPSHVQHDTSEYFLRQFKSLAHRKSEAFVWASSGLSAEVKQFLGVNL